MVAVAPTTAERSADSVQAVEVKSTAHLACLRDRNRQKKCGGPTEDGFICWHR